MSEWYAQLSEENKGKIIIACVGMLSTLLGAAIGGTISWWLTRSTQRLQQTISDSAIENQKVIAAAAVETQKALAVNNLKAQERAAIDTMLIKMIELMITYPFLENAAVCHKYPDIGKANLNNGENAKMRYEAYCIFVFNFLLRTFKHFDCDPAKLGDYIGLEEIVGYHHRWWFTDDHNYGYDEPFRQCIQAAYDKLRKDGKLK